MEDQKKTYIVAVIGDGAASWQIDLTDEEASLVRRVLDGKNARNYECEDYAPTISFFEKPKPVVVQPETKKEKTTQKKSKDLTYSLSGLLKDIKVS